MNWTGRNLTKAGSAVAFAGGVALASGLALALGGGAAAEDARAIQPEDLPVEAIERIVHDYLIANPEVLLAVQEELEKRQESRQVSRDRAVIARHASALFDDPDTPVGGNARGTITVVEFFDYKCGYCRRSKPVLDEIVAANPDVRLVYKEFPILGEQSMVAARAALAAHAQGKYQALHDALMRAPGTLDKQRILAIAETAGLDPERLSEEMESREVVGMIRRNHALAASLDIRGTPNFVIGERVIRGAPRHEQFEQLIAEARIALAEEAR